MIVPSWDSVVLWAATESPAPFKKEDVEPGFIGLAFFVVLAAAVVALVFSMRKRLANIDVTRHEREQQTKRRPIDPLDPSSPVD